MLTKKGYIFYI